MNDFTSPAIQAMNLIRYIGDEMSESGRPIEQLSGFSRIIGSPSEELANQIVEELDEKGLITHVYQADLQSIDRSGSYDDLESQVALQMRTEAGYGGDQTMVLRVPPGAGLMPRAS